VSVLDFEVALQEVDNGQVARRFPIRDRGDLKDQPIVEATGVRELIEEARLAYPCFANDRRHLTTICAHELMGMAEVCQLGIAPDKAGKPTCGRGFKPRSRGTGTNDLEDLDRFSESLHRDEAERLDRDVALG